MSVATESAYLARIASLEANLGGIVSVSLQQRMTDLGVPGLTVAAIKNGRVEWVEAYGLRDPIGSDPVLRGTPMQGGSLSKPVTAMAMMKLVEQGLIQLDEPVNDALIGWQLPENQFTENKDVTLRHLLSHTAGTNVPSFFGYNVATGQGVPNLLQVLDGIPPASSGAIRVIQEPETSWLYSGGGYTILQQILADVTGQSLPGWQKQNLFQPLLMMDSHFDQPLPAAQLPIAALGDVFGIPLPQPFAYPELPAAGLWSTALDMGRFVVGMQDALAGVPGALLSQATAQAVFTPQTPAPLPGELVGSDPRMGLGFFLVNGGTPDWFWHTGGNVGYTCIFAGDLQGGGYGAVVMTNSFPGGRAIGWEIINAIADIDSWPGWNDWGI